MPPTGRRRSRTRNLDNARIYHDRYSELERIKKRQAKEAGMIRSKLTMGKIAEELEKEQKYLQISTANYLIKVNEIRTKEGVELLQNLLEYYKSQQIHCPTTRKGGVALDPWKWIFYRQ